MPVRTIDNRPRFRMSSNATQKVRVQLDLPPREATALDALRDECHLTSRTDVVRTALAQSLIHN